MPGSDYPTSEDLQGLRTFEGTWREYMAYVKSIGNYWPDESFGWTEDSEGDTKNMIYAISTGGWSGNEEIISYLQDEPVWFMFWESSVRGGHYEIHIPFNMLDESAWHHAQEVGSATK